MDSPRKPQQIPLRVEYIKELLEGNDLKLLIDFDNNDTESYLNTFNQRDIRYVLNNSNVNKMVIGVRTPKHVEELVRDIEAPPLSDQLIKAIESLEEDNFGLVDEEGLGF